MAKNSQITIEFTNDGGDKRKNGNKNVYFRSDQTTEVIGPEDLWETKWNCGSEKEKNGCNRVRNGNFQWGGKYTITSGNLIV